MHDDLQPLSGSCFDTQGEAGAAGGVPGLAGGDGAAGSRNPSRLDLQCACMLLLNHRDMSAAMALNVALGPVSTVVSRWCMAMQVEAMCTVLHVNSRLWW